MIVPAERFKLVHGKDVLTTYTFNTGVAKRLRIRSFALGPGRSGEMAYGVALEGPLAP